MQRSVIIFVVLAVVAAGCTPAPTGGKVSAQSATSKLDALPKGIVTGPEAAVLARKLLGEVASQVVEARYEAPQDDALPQMALFGAPRASSIPGLCEVRVVNVDQNDRRTGNVASHLLNLGGRAVRSETRFRLLYPYWVGPPGTPDIPAMDAQMLRDDRQCAASPQLGRYFRASGAYEASIGAAMYWNAIRLAARKGQMPLAIVCAQDHPDCRQARRVLAHLSTDDMFSIVAKSPCLRLANGDEVTCASIEVNRLDHCGNHWKIEMEAVYSQVATADANAPRKVTVDPDPCDAPLGGLRQ